MTPSLRFNLIIIVGLFGAGLGAFVFAPLWDENPVLLGIVGFIMGLRIGDLLFKERHEKKERKHIYLPKDMRDSYYTNLVMKRIMEIYQPQQTESPDDEEESEDESEDDKEEEYEEEDIKEKSAYEDTSDEFRWKD